MNYSRVLHAVFTNTGSGTLKRATVRPHTSYKLFGSVLLYGCTSWTIEKGLEIKLDVNYTKILRNFFEQILEAALKIKNCCTATYPPSQKLSN